MSARTLITAAALLLAATSASLAQDSYSGRYVGHTRHHHSTHHFSPDVGRGGPGPRVGPGNGMGIGSQRG